MNKIILASGSPRRKQLLELAQIPFEVMVSNVDERFPVEFTPAQVAMHIAENKAVAVQKNKTNGEAQTIIAAETVVVLENDILGKPVEREDAVKMLSKLSGKTHKVITGVCILSVEKKIIFAEETEVEFLSLTKDQIEYYIDHFKPYDKAGAYAIQEWIGVVGIKSVNGNFYNVIGLPISRVIIELQKIK